MENERKDTIVVVDDDKMSLRLVKRVLEKAGISGQYYSSAADFLASAGEGVIAEGNIPDLMLFDIHMPEMNGLELLEHVRKEPSFRNVPVIFLTGDEDVRTETEGLNKGASDFIRKPFASEVLLTRVRNTIELNRLHSDMAREIKVKTEKLSGAYLQIVSALAASVDAKDRYTHGHSSRVAAYSREIAKRAGMSEAEQDTIYMMGLLHDVGKIGIQDAIINKAGRLTDEEFAQIKTHPEVGSQILKKIEDLPELMTGARWHHERFDGNGYPDGLAGEDIPETARIIAVADAYDAMTSNRSYRTVMPQEKVRAEVERCRGSQFDPFFADIMLSMIDEDDEYRMREE